MLLLYTYLFQLIHFESLLIILTLMEWTVLQIIYKYNCITEYLSLSLIVMISFYGTPIDFLLGSIILIKSLPFIFNGTLSIIKCLPPDLFIFESKVTNLIWTIFYRCGPYDMEIIYYSLIGLIGQLFKKDKVSITLIIYIFHNIISSIYIILSHSSLIIIYILILQLIESYSWIKSLSCKLRVFNGLDINYNIYILLFTYPISSSCFIEFISIFTYNLTGHLFLSILIISFQLLMKLNFTLNFWVCNGIVLPRFKSLKLTNKLEWLFISILHLILITILSIII